MKRETNASLKVSLKRYGLDVVRYAAYALSGEAYVFIAPAGRGAAAVVLSPKSSSRCSGKALLKRLRAELEDEKLRSSITAANRGLREFMLLKALSYKEPPASARDDAGLTPEQEKELDALIAQVESEIKKETAAGRTADPLGVTRTWEERYGAKAGRGGK